jgi:hypothetical protein
MTRPLEDLAHAVETVGLLLPYLPATERNMRASMPDTGGTSYDGGRRGAVPWCDIHEREVAACHRAELYCEGAPLDVDGDRTGEAAIACPVFAEAREVRRIAAAWARDAGWLVALVRRYRESDLPAERDEVAVGNEPACEVHGAAGIIRPRVVVMERAGDWPLPRPTGVCLSCRDRIRVTHRMPTVADVESFEQRGKWPLLHEVYRKAVGQ